MRESVHEGAEFSCQSLKTIRLLNATHRQFGMVEISEMRLRAIYELLHVFPGISVTAQPVESIIYLRAGCTPSSRYRSHRSVSQTAEFTP